MSKLTRDGGAAFPSGKSERSGFENSHPLNEGMSMRDYFAGQALQGILSGGGVVQDAIARLAKEGGVGACEYTADIAYKIADAMIKARGK